MADHIPFIITVGDLRRFKRYYADDSFTIRCSLDFVKGNKKALPKNIKWWIDPEIDGCDHILNGKKTSSKWRKYIGGDKKLAILLNKDFIKNTSHEQVKELVNIALGDCLRFSPAYITVPQLPMVNNTSRNKINRSLAEATGNWGKQHDFRGRFILPIIFTHQNQLKGRTQWRPKLDLAQKCYDFSKAQDIWTVDSSLSDQGCREKHPKRFDSLIDFHIDLKGRFPNANIITGPYWGINIVLWARGLADFPAINVGTSYKYYISGGYLPRTGKSRVLIEPLRRWASATAQLRNWLDDVLKKLSSTDPTFIFFKELRKNIDIYIRNKDLSKGQVAESYKKWFDKIASIPSTGRKLALYQDLSSAFVLGRQLPKLPKTEAPGRDPGKVAEQLMLKCL